MKTSQEDTIKKLQEKHVGDCRRGNTQNKDIQKIVVKKDTKTKIPREIYVEDCEKEDTETMTLRQKRIEVCVKENTKRTTLKQRRERDWVEEETKTMTSWKKIRA